MFLKAGEAKTSIDSFFFLDGDVFFIGLNKLYNTKLFNIIFTLTICLADQRPSRPNRLRSANNLLTFYLKKLISVSPLDSFVTKPLTTRSFSKSEEIMFERLMIRATVSAGFSLQWVENKEVQKLFYF